MTDCCNVEPVHGWDQSATVKVPCHVSIADAFFLPGFARRCASPRSRHQAPALRADSRTRPRHRGFHRGPFGTRHCRARSDSDRIRTGFRHAASRSLSRCQGAASGRAGDVEDGAFQKLLRWRRQRPSASCHAAGRCSGAARGLLLQPQTAWCLLSIHLRPKMPSARRNPRLPRSCLKEDRLDVAQYPAGCGLSHQPQVPANGSDRAAPRMMRDRILCFEAAIRRWMRYRCCGRR